MADDTIHEETTHEESAVEEAVAAPEPPAIPGGAPVMILKRNGAETEHKFPINPPAMIGRFDPAVGPIDVDLGTLPEGSYISRKHAKITLEDGVYVLHDLGSSNGSFVLKGEGADAEFVREESSPLADGTEFALGNARFVFKLEPAVAPVEPEPIPAEA
jgi:pSer/pThr/pTyr-binding forkhead associated (FHA) protein